MSGLLRRFAKRYVTADLYKPDVDLKLNIEETGLSDGEFDVIVFNHVLDYVDDRKALSELRRILRPGGLLILMIDVTEGIATYEDPTLSDADRESLFHDRDKLRLYGTSDFRDLIRASGFQFREHVAEGRSAIEHGLNTRFSSVGTDQIARSRASDCDNFLTDAACLEGLLAAGCMLQALPLCIVVFWRVRCGSSFRQQRSLPSAH